MITIFGIQNCDTMKKARRWLDNNNLEYAFHDYRKDGVDRGWLKARIDELGWEWLVNRRGTTWRKLSEDVRNTMDAASAIEILLEQPGMIKRPLLDTGDHYLLGFSETVWEKELK
ncbi:ArsC family reductase [Sansalvadorimonas sp. 2012CJ34-2]|uniref:ArsC family reductase n=1 Tax=Parendozoicomonas callyspongiae TaxID=2942213 RepID=A0ABT0PJK5_9GAMM|nr:ArsC family reductase [Sansalvadorimonas sp. 2012CJ34-2]MCL6271548.1 ArsC family reductase [Sansalvadorimonas sp. 2012CJ34-2]